MAKLNIVILPHKKLKDNSHKLRIALAHNGETKYIVTDIVISSLSNFKNGKIIKEKNADFLNTKIRKLIVYYQTLIEETDYVNSMTCGELLHILKNGGIQKRFTLNEVFLDFIENSSLKGSTKTNLSWCWKTILNAVGGDLYIDTFTRFTILEAQKKLKKQNLAPSTQRGYLNILKTITNHAIKNEYVSFKKDPWLNIKKPKTQIRDCWLTLEGLKKIRDMKLTNHIQDFWRNIFMLSFYFGGMNIADMIELDLKKISETGKIKYEREKSISDSRKTSTIEYTIPEEAKQTIENLMANKWYKKFNKAHMKTIATSLASALRSFRKEVDNENLIYYSARKTFSQIAFTLGINSYVIDYILGHSIEDPRSSLYHYVFVTPEMATDAIRKVLDYIK